VKPSQTSDHPAPCEPLTIDEPTLAMIFTVNTSPLAGREGNRVTSRTFATVCKKRLTNVSNPRGRLGHNRRISRAGRGELQLAILIETMRREGYELMVGNRNRCAHRK